MSKVKEGHTDLSETSSVWFRATQWLMVACIAIGVSIIWKQSPWALRNKLACVQTLNTI